MKILLNKLDEFLKMKKNYHEDLKQTYTKNNKGYRKTYLKLIEQPYIKNCQEIINKWNVEFFKRNANFCKGSICFHTIRKIQLDRFDYLYYKRYRSIASQDVLLKKHIDISMNDGLHYQEFIVKKAVAKDFFILVSISDILPKYWICKLRGMNKLRWNYTKFKS